MPPRGRGTSGRTLFDPGNSYNGTRGRGRAVIRPLAPPRADPARPSPPPAEMEADIDRNHPCVLARLIRGGKWVFEPASLKKHLLPQPTGGLVVSVVGCERVGKSLLCGALVGGEPDCFGPGTRTDSVRAMVSAERVLVIDTPPIASNWLTNRLIHESADNPGSAACSCPEEAEHVRLLVWLLQSCHVVVCLHNTGTEEGTWRILAAAMRDRKKQFGGTRGAHVILAHMGADLTAMSQSGSASMRARRLFSNVDTETADVDTTVHVVPEQATSTRDDGLPAYVSGEPQIFGSFSPRLNALVMHVLSCPRGSGPVDPKGLPLGGLSEIAWLKLVGDGFGKLVN